MQENCEDLFGIGEYKKGYINTLNLRSSEYSDYEFSKCEIQNRVNTKSSEISHCLTSNFES